MATSTVELSRKDLNNFPELNSKTPSSHPPLDDDWIGHRFFYELQKAAEGNTALRRLPGGEESQSNIGPIEVDRIHIHDTSTGAIRVRVRKGFQSGDIILHIYINQDNIIIRPSRLWEKDTDLITLRADSAWVTMQLLAENLQQYQHLI